VNRPWLQSWKWQAASDALKLHNSSFGRTGKHLACISKLAATFSPWALPCRNNNVGGLAAP